MKSALENVVQILAEKIREKQSELQEIDRRIDDLSEDAKHIAADLESIEHARRTVQDLQTSE